MTNTIANKKFSGNEVSSVDVVRPRDFAPKKFGKNHNLRKKIISVRGLKKSFGETIVYDNFEIDLPQGQLISVFGPNGCGKSTLINMISGLLPMDSGEVLYDGQTIQETKISYVFQNYREALFPWLRSIDNVFYPLKVMGIPRNERERRVEELLANFDRGL